MVAEVMVFLTLEILLQVVVEVQEITFQIHLPRLAVVAEAVLAVKRLTELQEQQILVVEVEEL
jgi:hypothetical protein